IEPAESEVHGQLLRLRLLLDGLGRLERFLRLARGELRPREHALRFETIGRALRGLVRRMERLLGPLPVGAECARRRDAAPREPELRRNLERLLVFALRL